MKAFLLSVAFCFSTLLLFSQNYFAPVGTHWYYMRYQFDPAPPDPSYAEVTVTDTATIDGKPCILINGGADCGILPNPTYIYMDGGKVFFKHNDINQFLPLYDFDAGVGETFKTYTVGGTQCAIFKVKFIELKVVDGQLFQIQHIELDSGYVSWGQEVVQYAGSTGFLFPQMGTCDPELGDLLCFNNSTIGYPEFPCGIVSTSETQNDELLQIFPNPASDRLTLSFNLTERMQVSAQILDLLGRVVVEKSFRAIAGKNQIEMDMQNIPAGTYFISLNRKIIGKTIVK